MEIKNENLSFPELVDYFRTNCMSPDDLYEYMTMKGKSLVDRESGEDISGENLRELIHQIFENITEH